MQNTNTNMNRNNMAKFTNDVKSHNNKDNGFNWLSLARLSEKDQDESVHNTKNSDWCPIRWKADTAHSVFYTIVQYLSCLYDTLFVKLTPYFLVSIHAE